MAKIIDWKKVQPRIQADDDGVPGRETYGNLFACAVGRPPNGRPLDPVFTRLADAAVIYFPVFGVMTAERISSTIAETAHETDGFTRFEENLSYSPDRLAAVWPGRYAVDPKAKSPKPNAKAISLARRPRELAIDTYGLRMGNKSAAQDNDTNPDGWQYRGRGMTMLTGRGNYEEVGKALGLPLLTEPDLAADPFVSLRIALWFYERKGVFRAADVRDWRLERKLVNGGDVGLDAVNRIRTRVLALIEA